MFQVRVPGKIVVLCACIAAWPSLAQEGPTEEELESARLRLQQALESRGLPPAAFESDPVPDWAVPDHEPKVLRPPAETAPETAPQETVDPGLLEEQREQNDTAQQPAPKKPPAARKQKPKKKPAVAREKGAPPRLKTGRAVAGDRKTEKPKPAQRTPAITLPESLRP